jgi:hypothetical protein
LKAARNGGFSFISNGFRPLRVFTEITEITVFSEKCCQNVVTKQACKKQENPSPSVCRERGAKYSNRNSKARFSTLKNRVKEFTQAFGCVKFLPREFESHARKLITGHR